MYPISNAVKALFESEQRQILRITGADKNGTAINITDADVVIDSFNIDRYSCNGEKLEIGTAIAAEMTLELDNHDGRFNGIVFEGTELFVEIGIADWTQDNPTVNWIPCGYFAPDEQPRSLSTITIKALDRMTRFDAVPPTLTPWTTQSGEVITTANGEPIYFVSNVRFPITVANLVARVALLCNIPFTQSLTSFPNYNYTLSALPTLQQEITFRNLIQWCAGIMGANAWIDWTGSLRFAWYGATTGYTSTTANRFSSDLHEDNITITGVQYTNTQNVTIVSGSADYAIDMTGNYLAAVGISTILPNIRSRISGFTYRPFTATVINAPYLWPMDMITFVKDGVDYTCALTNVNFGINGTTELQSKGETAQMNNGVAPNGVTKEQGFLIEQAHEATTALDQSLNQEGIFNRLTDNGETQGLILYDGKVYLNASYIQTGTMVADFIKGGTLTLGGLNNQSGVLEVRDASNNVIGTWNKDGVTGTSFFFDGKTSSYLQMKDVGSNYSYVFRCDFNGIKMHDDMPSYGRERIVALKQAYVDEDNYGFGLTIKGTDNVGDYKLHCADNIVISKDFSGQYTFEGYNDIDIVLSYNGLVGWLSASGGSSAHYTYGINCNVPGGLYVTGTKSRVVSTDQYSDRLLYCYETPSPMFGDIGEGKIGEDGKCYVWLDPVFAQTITTTQYQVFLQKYGDGDAWVKERKGSYFIVEGTPNMAFGWEIKAKQADYDQRRLDKAEQPYSPPEQTYGADAAQYINNLRKERISE